jgi:HTH-type transcriptional regulator, sugar sensing transcriptional regulator
MRGATNGADDVHALVDLGMSGLEAEAYAFLLRESPATGYRVAQAIRKPAANTYKALESLQTKGAVIVESGTSRLHRAVPPDEFLRHLDRRFQEQRARALSALRRVRGGADDDRVYQLRSPGQVLERCRAMLARARRIALVDAFPEPLARIRADLEAAVARGVEVAVKGYEPSVISGASVVVAEDAKQVKSRWPGQWLNVVADGQEHLLALFANGCESLHQAVWSGSAYVSWVYHSALASEITLSALADRIEKRVPAAELRRLLARFDRLVPEDAPGRRMLIERFGRTHHREGDSK